MSFSTYLRKFAPSSDPKISLLIPFRSDGGYREKVLRWLLRYWKHQLPDVEVVIGRSKSHPFSKTEAFNDAVSRSKGKVLVLLDADAYLDGTLITKCADRVLEDLDNHLWYVPYRHMYRLNEPTTNYLLSHDPKIRVTFTQDSLPHILDDDGSKSGIAHRYGAMIMIIPRQAYNTIRCFDERFAGWGGEDIAILKALDTLYGKHKLVNSSIYHLWHPKIGSTYQTRQWEGQDRSQINQELAVRYSKATRNPSMMQQLVNEAWEYKYGKRFRNKIQAQT